MKTFQLATVLRILENSKNEEVTQVEMVNKLILSLVGTENYKQFRVDEVTANRLFGAIRPLSRDIKKEARTLPFDIFRNQVNENIIPLLIEAEFDKIEQSIKATLDDDNSISVNTHIGSNDASFTKKAILSDKSLSFLDLLSATLYYVSINSDTKPDEKNSLRRYIKEMLERTEQEESQSLSTDDQKIMEDLLTDADNGMPDAQFCLGYMYFYGLPPIPQNYYRAGYYLHKAALAGDAEAIYMLSIIFKNGLDVEQSYDQALTLLQMAADLEYPAAQFELGQWYYEGKNLPKDIAKAIELWQKAADQDNSDALIAIGAAYQCGIDGIVKRNIGTAYKCYNKAKELGHPLAQKYLDELF